MSKAKFNVLMMRDNSPVKRFRLSPVWLKFGLYLFLLLIVSAVAGGYFGMRYWEENRSLHEELGSVQRELREARIELERLQNIDKILKSNDPNELQALFGNVVATPAKDRPAPAPTPPPPPKVNLSQVFQRVDLQQVKVDNLQAKIMGSSMRVTFNLNNLQTEESVTGRADLELVTNTGKDADLNLNKNDLVFQIQRFKQISTTFALPASVPASDVFGIRLEIRKPTGQVIFSETYPLSTIMF